MTNIGRPMRKVILESPYAGNVEANIAYARRALRDCLLRNESPLASHLLFTAPGVLDDGIPHERELGIQAGLAWGFAADATVVYTDLGVSAGMKLGIERATIEGRPVEYREIGCQIPATDIDAEIVETARRFADSHQRDGHLRTAMVLRQCAWEIERLQRRVERAEAWIEQLKAAGRPSGISAASAPGPSALPE